MSCLYNIFFKTNRVVSVTCEESPVVFPSEECPVCLESCCHKNLLTLPCGHSFHTWCILEWFDKQMTCPVCRRRFKWVGHKKKKRRRRHRYHVNRHANLIS
jgi:hypothetical protein